MTKPAQHSRGKDGNGSDAGPSLERQPVPGHTENLPVGSDKDAAQQRGPSEDRAPTATPDTKPGTPPGTQSDRDRQRAGSD